MITKVLLFVSFLASVHSYSADNSWDILVFTQNWPTSVCNKWMEQNGNTCAKFPSSIWTIHGIWPSKLGTFGPNSCYPSSPFRMQDIYSLESQLDQLWTPIQQRNSKTSFWAHEWTKHGTCATQLPQLSTQLKYFSQGLEWIKKYNMANVLSAVGILPGQRRSVSDLFNGVRRVLGKVPEISCYLDGQRNSVLLEVRLCFDKSLSLVDCNSKKSNCRANQLVHYPK